MSKRKDGQARGKYTLEFKMEAVRLVKGGQAIPVTAKILDVPVQTLGNGVRLSGKGQLKANGTYLSPKEAFSVSITEIKDSETPALALETAYLEWLRPVPNWRFRLSKCHSNRALNAPEHDSAYAEETPP